MEKVYRHENKYMINPQQKKVTSSRLEKVCKRDPNADGNNAYRVSSLCHSGGTFYDLSVLDDQKEVLKVEISGNGLKL